MNMNTADKFAMYKFAQDTLTELGTSELEEITKIREWGIWSRGGYPTGKRGEGIQANITDEEALLIDRQVAALKTLFSRAYFILCELYKWDKGINELARSLDISNRRVMDYRDKGLSFIYGGLQESLDMSH